MSTVARIGTTFETRRLIDTDTRAAAIALHTVWGQTLGAVTAASALRDLEDFLRLIERSLVVKLLAYDDAELVGVSFLTNDLEMVPGISADFFRARYPVEAAASTLFYAISGVAHPTRPGILDGLRRRAVTEAHHRHAEVLVWDAPTLQRDAAHRTTIEAVEAIARTRVEPMELDRVSYMAVELPKGEVGQVIDLRTRND
ncbi:MAG: hypothetical protein OEX04_17350 [Acidimicrobiia bacterium]|nr:hypothetical protein [Acidimicrobiia bacterium]MDH4309237.1 hypothetical protein [Acidimicrobiia bacterium]